MKQTAPLPVIWLLVLSLVALAHHTLAASKLFTKPETKCTEWGYCDQSCSVNADSSSSCSCNEGYELVEGHKCIASNSDRFQLLFALGREILKTDVASNTTKYIAKTSSIGGLDYHFEHGVIFWSDLEENKIFTAPLDPSDTRSASRLVIDLPDKVKAVAIAVDWITDKIYIADAIGHKIDVVEFDGSNYSTVISSSKMWEPTDLVIDPVEGLLFVAENERIFRASMDGSSIKPLVTNAARKVSGIAIDAASKRLFWSDKEDYSIETVGYDGRNRHLIIRGAPNNPAPFRLALFERTVFWTDGGIRSVGKFNGGSMIEDIYGSRNATDAANALKALHPLLQPKEENPCGLNNGGCAHLCLLTAKKEDQKNESRFTCACGMGYRLDSDQKSCVPVENYLLYLQPNFIKGKIISSTSDAFSDAIAPIPTHSGSFNGLDIDVHDEFIYTSTTTHNANELVAISRVHPNGTGYENILALCPDPGKGIEGIAVDWVSKNLYYIDTAKRTLNVLSTRHPKYRRTLIRNLKQPKGIVVHPNKGYIFYSDWDEATGDARICRANLDGSDHTVLPIVPYGEPYGLAIDYDADRLYWFHTRPHFVRHSNLDGTDEQTMLPCLVGYLHPHSMVVFKETVYFTDWQLEVIASINKTSQDEGAEVIIEERYQPYGIKVYAKEAQKVAADHPCASDNGGCEKFCFAVPSLSAPSGLMAACACSNGQELSEDGKGCAPESGSDPDPDEDHIHQVTNN